jgi:hypothetical protein
MDPREVTLSGFPAQFSDVMTEGQDEVHRLDHRKIGAESAVFAELVPEAANEISFLARMLQRHEQDAAGAKLGPEALKKTPLQTKEGQCHQ